MTDTWLNRWNERYGQKEYAYGTEPNAFLKAQLDRLTAGNILFGAEGEGRNAVYAATLGWKVSAFDISIEGQRKALALAKEHHVSIDYQVGLLPDLGFEDGTFDAVALIYAHFPPDIRAEYHRLLSSKLKTGGILILEAFGKNNLEYRNRNPAIGGPPDQASLISTDELRSDFEHYEILQLEEVEVELNEGLYHNGTGSVTRFIGRKK